MQTTLIDKELANIKQQMSDCDQEIDELKLSRNDLLEHIKINNQVKKSKNQAEIIQGQTLIFDTGNYRNRAQKRRKNK